MVLTQPMKAVRGRVVAAAARYSASAADASDVTIAIHAETAQGAGLYEVVGMSARGVSRLK